MTESVNKPRTTAEQPLRAHSPEVSAARARRWGSFFYAEQVLRVMRNYGWSVILYSVGQPVAYLFAMGVGLASLVDANSEAAFGGVSYLEFVAPALLVSAAVMTRRGGVFVPPHHGRLQMAPRVLWSACLAADTAADRQWPHHGQFPALPVAVVGLFRGGGHVWRFAESLGGLGLGHRGHGRGALLRLAADGLCRQHQAGQGGSSHWCSDSSSCRSSCSPGRSSRWIRCRSQFVGSVGYHRCGTELSWAGSSPTGWTKTRC